MCSGCGHYTGTFRQYKLNFRSQLHWDRAAVARRQWGWFNAVAALARNRKRIMPRRRRRKPEWLYYSDHDLLDLRFCDLEVSIRGSVLEARIGKLYEELDRRGIRFRPHCWLSEEWFSPDGIPGIAIPFFLAHPRLAKLEARQMFEVEGGSENWCMQLLRHEAGHAIDTAFRLHRRRRWRQLFGRFGRTYPLQYTPNPMSKNFVLHLDWWYAQSHPAEDFAETFAVWLRPKSRWRKEYGEWPVVRKLQYVDELMKSIAGKGAPVRSRRHVEPLSSNRKTLRRHYEEKRESYGVNIPEVYDGDLIRLFPDAPPEAGRRRSAAAFLSRIKADLCMLCSRGTGQHPYVIAQVVQEMAQRCREMKLHLARPEQEARVDVAIFIAIQTLNYVHEIRHRVAL